MLDKWSTKASPARPIRAVDMGGTVHGLNANCLKTSREIEVLLVLMVTLLLPRRFAAGLRGFGLSGARDRHVSGNMNSITKMHRPSSQSVVLPAVEADSFTTEVSGIYRSIHPVLQELECQNASSLQGKGMLIWTLHKNVENDPSSAIVLVDELVKDLETVRRRDNQGCTIPLLLTLIYVIFQSAYIPVDLYKRAYAVCMSLLTLPKPFCNVALACVRHMQTEWSKPGALFQRTVIAEHSLGSKFFPFQEMMFVFADEAVFSDPLANAVQRHLETAVSCRPSLTLKRTVLLHTLQAALGERCHGDVLAFALKSMGKKIEQHFLDVVQFVEQHANYVGQEDRDLAVGYRERLQEIYHQILTDAGEGEVPGSSLCGTPLPTPDVRFHVWRKDSELLSHLEKWTLQSPAESRPDIQRASQVSMDSGIERDLPENETTEAPALQSRLTRKPVLKKKSPWSSSFDLELDGDRANRASSITSHNKLCQFTACVMVMGDDRALGRLAQVYHTLRTGGERYLSLRNRVTLEIYYIPITGQPTSKDGTLSDQSYLDLATHLGRLDPWYECNINSLAHWIPTLVDSENSNRSMKHNPFLLDVLSNYKRTAWQPVHFTIYSVKISFSDPKKSLEKMFLTQLDVDFQEGLNSKVESLKKDKMPKVCGPLVSITYQKLTLSNRKVDLGTSVRAAGIQISPIPCSESEDPSHNLLNLSFKGTPHKGIKQPVIKSRNIKIKTVENRTFTVCLDKDQRKTYEDVRSIEISPCLDPRSIRKRSVTETKLNLRREREVTGDYCMTENLSLPINTFSGRIQ
ncbi:hypothetical protein GJAV_G00219920 [Gymnothorax javanicus]|nr:hypothetical protein GJAV_G00219920 [Gymnothorax javanicus]